MPSWCSLSIAQRNQQQTPGPLGLHTLVLQFASDLCLNTGIEYHLQNNRIIIGKSEENYKNMMLLYYLNMWQDSGKNRTLYHFVLLAICSKFPLQASV